MLALAGAELFHFTVASIGLCLGFVLEKGLIMQVHFPYCPEVFAQSRHFLPLTPTQQ